MAIVRRKTSGSAVGLVPVLNVIPANGHVLVYDAAAGAAKFAAFSTLVTGTPDGTKFLRDDMTWQAASGGSGLTQPQILARASIGF